jgi:hypothetical protein
MLQFLFQAGVAVRRHRDLRHSQYPNSKKLPAGGQEFSRLDDARWVVDRRG